MTSSTVRSSERLGVRRGPRLRARLLAATALLSALTFAHTNAGPDERTLSLVSLNSGEKLTVVYKRNGQYVASGLKQLNHILRDLRRDRETEMDPKLFDVLWEVYQESGAKAPITIICGYRSPDTNEFLRRRSSGVAKNSQHINGKAMDFFLPDVPLAKLREIGLRLQAGGVGFYPTSGYPFVHMDTGSVRHWPAMTRDQLVKVFPNGRSLHIPSDGNPLPGYAEALAEYRAKGMVMSTTMVAGRRNADEDEDRKTIARSDAKAGDVKAVAAADAKAAADTRTTRMASIVPVPRPSPEREKAIETASATAAAAPVPTPAPERMRGRLGTIVERTRVAAVETTGDGGVSAAHAAAVVSAETTSTIRPANEPLPVLAFASATGGDRFDPLKILRGEGNHSAGVTNARVKEALPETAASPSNWRDPNARLVLPVSLAGSAAFWTAEASLRQAPFAELRTGDPRTASVYFDKPGMSYAAGFAPTAYVALRTDRFSGPLVRPVAMVDPIRGTTTNLAWRVAP